MPAPGAPGSSSRGRGGKFKKYTRGGGHHFSRDLQPVDSDGNHISMWSKDGQNKIRRGAAAEDDDDDDEESSEEEDSDEEAGPSNAAGAASREDRKAQKKARKDAAIARQKAGAVEVGDMPSSDEDSDDDDDMPANPNHSKAAREQTLAPKPADDVDEITDGVKKLQTPNRRERETLEAKAAKERYLKLQAQGKTDEAKADMARLKLIREQREAESARRQAEKEEKETQEKTRRAEMEAREAKRREAAAGPKKGKKK